MRPWAPIVLFLLIIGLPGVAALFFDVGDVPCSRAIGGDFRLAAFGYAELLFWR